MYSQFTDLVKIIVHPDKLSMGKDRKLKSEHVPRK